MNYTKIKKDKKFMDYCTEEFYGYEFKYGQDENGTYWAECKDHDNYISACTRKTAFEIRSWIADFKDYILLEEGITLR